jgi:putative two-component system response regulator
MKEIKTQKVALIVDDDEDVLNLIKSLLEAEKIKSLCAKSSDEAIGIFKTSKYIDLLVVDYFLPDASGTKGTKIIEFAKSLRPNLPIIAISGSAEEAELASLVAGAIFMISKPFGGIEFSMIVRNLLSLTEAYDRLKNADSIMEALETALEARDSYTQGHGKRVAEFSVDLYDALGLNDREQKSALFVGGMLHDVGKIGIPDSILKSSEKLTPEEFEEIKKHPKIGYDICQNLTKVDGSLDVVLYHHERLDGSGYPEKLTDGDIPLLAQIAGIIDVYDAITSKRTYRDEMTIDKALEVLENDATKGKLNKKFVEVFKKLILEKEKSK